MPFKSKDQMRLFWAKEENGELPKGTAQKWSDETPNKKDLPENIKESSIDVSDWYDKIVKSSSDIILAELLMEKAAAQSGKYPELSLLGDLTPSKETTGLTKELIKFIPALAESTYGGAKELLSLMFQTAPTVAFSVPFVAGGINHILNKELTDQRRKHKKKMRQLEIEFPEEENEVRLI